MHSRDVRQKIAGHRLRIEEKEKCTKEDAEYTISEMGAMLFQQFIQVGRKGEECQCVASDGYVERQVGNACSGNYELIAGCLGVQIEEPGPQYQAGYAATDPGTCFAFLLTFSKQNL